MNNYWHVLYLLLDTYSTVDFCTSSRGFMEPCWPVHAVRSFLGSPRVSHLSSFVISVDTFKIFSKDFFKILLSREDSDCDDKGAISTRKATGGTSSSPTPAQLQPSEPSNSVVDDGNIGTSYPGTFLQFFPQMWLDKNDYFAVLWTWIQNQCIWIYNTAILNLFYVTYRVAYPAIIVWIIQIHATLWIWILDSP